MRQHVALWVQNSPRRQWVLKVTVDTPDAIATCRTWFDEYDHRGPPPPPSVTVPVALACAAIARAAMQQADVRGKFQVQLYGGAGA